MTRRILAPRSARAPAIAAALALSLVAAAPLSAQENDRGLSLMEQGVQLFFRGLQKEMEPALEELGALTDELGPALRSFADEMGPALGQLLQEVEDWSAYHPPEILPNGDIILRRKADRPLSAEPADPEQTDL
ncbi:hypothetical protein [Shimia sp.]|uniref:hypothetical protein n=1 Tax=Shimia sp. TaxID=1954381 RepID=UPI003566AE3F